MDQIEMDDIRRFRVLTKYTRKDLHYDLEIEFRLLQPHKRGILLNNGRRVVSVPFPHTLCWSGMKVDGYYGTNYGLYGLAFVRDAKKFKLNTPVWVPPISNFTLFVPDCHPTSDMGRDSFEFDFNGVFGSPFTNQFHEALNQESFNVLGSYREWSALTSEQVLEKLAPKRRKLVDMCSYLLPSYLGHTLPGTLELEELEPIKGRKINGTR